MTKKRIWLIAIVSIIMFVLSACGNNVSNQAAGNSANDKKQTNSNDNKELPTIRVGMIGGGMTPLLAQIGIYDGSFKKAGVNVQEVSFNAGPDAVNAFVGGSTDVNLGSYDHVLELISHNLGVKAYGEIYNGVGYSLIVKKDAPYQSLKDLKGQTLAVTKPGSLSDSGLRKGLQDAGVNSKKDVNIIASGSGSTMLAAIESGKVAGGMVSEPTISQMIATGKYRVLYEPKFNYAGIDIMAKTDWVNKNKKAMQIFADELKAINDRAQKDPQHVVDVIKGKFPNVKPAILETAVKKQLAHVPPNLIVTKEGAKIATDISIELNLIKKATPYEDAVDSSLFQ